jgi:excisionase family DNA binding protein
MPPANPLNDLLELVRSAAREGVVEALRAQGPVAPKAVTPLVDKRMLAHALGVSIPSIDRLCRSQRIPYVLVGELRRFDLEAVREALRASAPGPLKVEHSPAPPAAAPCSEEVPIPGVRLLSRHGGSR